MADEVELDPMQGGIKVAADEIANRFFQRIKLIFGSDGQNAGDVAEDNGLPTVGQDILLASAGVGLIPTAGIQLEIDDANSQIPAPGKMCVVRALAVSSTVPVVVFLYDTNDADALTDVTTLGQSNRLISSIPLKASGVGSVETELFNFGGPVPYTKGVRAYVSDFTNPVNLGPYGVLASYYQ